MSKTLELLSRASKTGTPIGECDLCDEQGPLKDVRIGGGSREFVCIPCAIDRNLS